MHAEPRQPLPPQTSQPQPAPANAAPFDWSEPAPPPPQMASAEPGNQSTEGKYAWALQADSAGEATDSNPTGQITETLPAVPDTESVSNSQRGTNPNTTTGARGRGRIVLAGLLAASLTVAAGIGLLRGGDQKDMAASNPGEPSAAGAPGPAHGPAITPESTIAPSSTTVTSVELRPSANPSTTVTLATGSGEKPAASSPTTVAAKEVQTPEKRYLASEEVQKIIAATKYEGLTGHRFEITEEFTTAAAKYVVVSVDGTKSAVPISELKADIARAEAEAAGRPSFSAQVQLAPGVTRTIGFKVGPAKLTRDGADTRYIMYTDLQLNSLTAPVRGFPDSSTISLPYKHLNVSLIKVHGSTETVDGVSANEFYTGVESNQTAMAFDIDPQSEAQLDQERPDMSYVSDSSDYLQQKLALANIGREIYTNSLAYAQECAEAGIPYAQYKEQAGKIPLRAYAKTNARYLILGEAQYRTLG